MTGYELLTPEQRAEMDNLTERRTHADTSRFSGIDAATLAEFDALTARLRFEWLKEHRL